MCVCARACVCGGYWCVCVCVRGGVLMCVCVCVCVCVGGKITMLVRGTYCPGSWVLEMWLSGLLRLASWSLAVTS